MKRCDWCGGKFGLICHRHYGKRFCRKPCKAAHVRRRRDILSARLVHWLQVLHLANAYALHNVPGRAATAGLRQPDLALVPIASDLPQMIGRVRSLAKIHNH
jgi:hypothetical protein